MSGVARRLAPKKDRDKEEPALVAERVEPPSVERLIMARVHLYEAVGESRRSRLRLLVDHGYDQPPRRRLGLEMDHGSRDTPYGQLLSWVV